MLAASVWIRDLLIPFMAIGFAILIALLLGLVTHRLVLLALAARDAALAARYRPFVDAALGESAATDAIARLRRAPGRHRRVVGGLLLAPLAFVRGDISERAIHVADEADLLWRWRRGLTDRAWWVRAESALALGLLRDRTSLPSLLSVLDDEHQQVRAAAIDSLGRIGDPSAAPELLARLPQQSRYDRARVVEALRMLGTNATPTLLDHAASHPVDRPLAAEVLSYVGSAEALPVLIEWTSDDRADTRAAAWRAIAAIGVDTRAYYYALRALQDESAQVRAAAALALGRSGRDDAARYLADRLDDEWIVAAQAARALTRTGVEGILQLRARADGPEGLGQQLARQLAWETAKR